jgi:phosphatidylinositol alpha-mannosyltransferase
VRIALVAEDYYPQVGGIPEHVHNLALQFTERGHTVTVVSSRMRGAYPRDYRPTYDVRRIGTSVVIYANGGVSRITVGWRLRAGLEALFREGRFDVVHVHGGLAPTFGTLTPLAARRVGIPVVATFHSWFPRSAAARVFRRPLQRIMDLHAATIAVSAPVVEAYSRYFSANWEIIPNGVDIGYFRPNGGGSAGQSARGPRLLYLHRLEPRNHLGTLLRAMPLILRHFPATQLLVAGDGPWRTYYRRQAAPLESSVRFLGRVEDRPDWYRSVDLYLCATTRAAFGITLLEAMACGVPMVVGDNPGFRALVNGGQEAVVLPHHDAAAWAGAVVALLGDPARREAMGRAGVMKAAGFAWPRVAGRVMEVYERVVR